jgi:hypothetical protein
MNEGMLDPNNFEKRDEGFASLKPKVAAHLRSNPQPSQEYLNA